MELRRIFYCSPPLLQVRQDDPRQLGKVGEKRSRKTQELQFLMQYCKLGGKLFSGIKLEERFAWGWHRHHTIQQNCRRACHLYLNHQPPYSWLGFYFREKCGISVVVYYSHVTELALDSEWQPEMLSQTKTNDEQYVTLAMTTMRTFYFGSNVPTHSSSPQQHCPTCCCSVLEIFSHSSSRRRCWSDVPSVPVG